MPASSVSIRFAQSRQLARLVRRLAPTACGQAHGLAQLDPGAGDLVERFRAQVPEREYADLEPFIRRAGQGEAGALSPERPVALAQTSGTSRGAGAAERYIPQDAALLAHHRRGGLKALIKVAFQAPSVLGARMLMLGGCTTLDASGPVPSGDLSGIAAAGLPWWIRHRYEPGAEISAIPDWNRRLDAVAARCAGQNLRLASGIPAWLLMLFDRMRQQDRPRPPIKAVIHGGHGVEPFIPALLSHLAPATVMQEVYPASEAFIAVGATPWRLGDARPSPLELLTDHGVYLEFVTDDGVVHGAHELAPGGVYRLLVTTPGGLLRYRIGDLIRAEGPGLIRVAGRTAHRLSVFGEHVEGDALAQALAGAAQGNAAVVAHWHVAPVLPKADEPRGGHEWWIEFTQPPADAQAFLGTIDAQLKASVIDYAAHRDGGQLLPPSLRTVPPGTFHAWLAATGRLGGQRKVPIAGSDRAVADQLSRYAGSSHA